MDLRDVPECKYAFRFENRYNSLLWHSKSKSRAIGADKDPLPPCSITTETDSV